MKNNYNFYGWESADVPAVTDEYETIKTPRDLYDALSEIWCEYSCAPRFRKNWSDGNRTLGQCSITAFLAQDIFGGKVYGIPRPGGSYHCYNVVGESVFDLTSEQFGEEVLDYTDNPEQFREVHFAKEEKRARYEYLREELRKRYGRGEYFKGATFEIVGKIGFLYPGQGVQTAGMGKDFYENSALARAVYDQASEAVGLDMRKLCFEENNRLDLTEYTQVALVTTYLAMTKELTARGVNADIAAGLSLGECAAVTAAGAMTQEQAVRFVRKRGILMQDTVPVGEGAMCAVFSLDEKVIEEILAGMEGVFVANYNCPGQIVITGKTAQVEAAKEKLRAAGAKRCIMLNVSGPFHSPLLKKAGEELAAELERMAFGELKIPYVTNVTAKKVTDKEEIKPLLARQVYSPVYWMQSVKTMLQEGADTFIEIGPGRTLAGFMKKIAPEVKVCQLAKWGDLEALSDQGLLS